VDALDKMREHKIDAIITDIGMPRMDGIFLTREISKQQPGLPVMVMTAFDEEYSVGTAISVGAREFIKKPISLEECAIRLHKMIRESEPLTGVKVEKSKEEEHVEKDLHLLVKELETALKKD
jgi:DNA-binding NarL/FixJ family response regulator